MNDALLVIDEGTSSTRAVLVDADNGAFVRMAQQALTTRFPRPGWVEQDAGEIWRSTLRAARDAIDEDGKRVLGIGITNQRETVVAWDASTGEPLGPAIVWQDRRTAEHCTVLRDCGHEPSVQARTGLLLDPYFSATKMRWMLDHWPALREAGDRLRLGTIDSWLLFRLTGGLHACDATNASRTALMDLGAGWDDGLCDLFGVPRSALPTIVDCAGEIASTDPALFGRAIPITGLAGDQQAAAIGQSCLVPGDTKATLGTGAFILSHAGNTPPTSANRLLSTVAWQIAGTRAYALEGSLFVAGQMVQWARDELAFVGSSADTATLASSVESSGGVQVMPGFAGLGAPHWDANARGAILGLTLASTRAHVVRAMLEAVSNQCGELQRAFAADGVTWSKLRIDGGMAANDFLAQDLADVLALRVERPANVESTVLGAAILAAVGCGLYPSLASAAAAMGSGAERFDPRCQEDVREDRRTAWDKAVAVVRQMGS